MAWVNSSTAEPPLSQQLYSLSAQVQRDRTAYGAVLQCTQKGTLGVTAWLEWFLATVHQVVDQAQHGVCGCQLAATASNPA